MRLSYGPSYVKVDGAQNSACHSHACVHGATSVHTASFLTFQVTLITKLAGLTDVLMLLLLFQLSVTNCYIWGLN